ncbi:LysM domain-containing protein [Nonomuraea sp. NPDC023979]|uniref:LysM peptidoglycan-binding domain-containing protein n=1 Tax=Nonomuraea sp. NPDC023979 TaxID=3154796 RepID=UPI0034097875
MTWKTALAISTVAALLSTPAVMATPAAATSVTQEGAEATVLACYYFVKRGDTARGIAGKLGISYSTLAALNPGVDLNNLHVGQRLRVPEANCDW